MDWSEMFPSRFLKSQQLKKGDATLTIKSVYLDKDLPGKKKGTKETRGIVTFAETELEWVLNKTNASCLALMFGRETAAWLGKRVTLWPAPFTNPFTGEVTTALRVRGSPDLAGDMPGIVQVGRDAVNVTMKKTVPRGKAQAAPAAAPTAAAPPATPTPAVSSGPFPPMTEEEAAAILASESEQAAGLS